MRKIFKSDWFFSIISFIIINAILVALILFLLHLAFNSGPHHHESF